MRKRSLVGVEGVSASLSIANEFFDDRGGAALLILPGREAVKLNKFSRVMYSNPHYLVSNNMQAMVRLGGTRLHWSMQFFYLAHKAAQETGMHLDLFHEEDIFTTAWKKAGRPAVHKVHHIMPVMRKAFEEQKARLVAANADPYVGGMGRYENDLRIEKVDAMISWTDAELYKWIMAGLSRYSGGVYEQEREWVVKDKRLRLPKSAVMIVIRDPNTSLHDRVAALISELTRNWPAKNVITAPDKQKAMTIASRYAMNPQALAASTQSAAHNLTERASVVKTVRGATYYWTASNPGVAVRIGMKVPKSTATWRMGSPLSGATLAEGFLEDVRKDEFPMAPSRLGGVFVCPSPEGFCGERAANWSGLGAGVYAVRVTGRVLHTAADIFDEVTRAMGNVADYTRVAKSWRAGPRPEKASEYDERVKKARERALYHAREYWRGSTWAGHQQPEVIVDGEVTVLGLVKPSTA
jgi:hypothetical protein